jgi:hypothetical protein
MRQGGAIAMMPIGYWNLYQTAQVSAMEAEEKRGTRETMAVPPFGGRHLGRAAAWVLQEALVSGELRAAGVCDATGEIFTMQPAVWRRHFTRPDGGGELIPFDEALAGRSIPLAVTGDGQPSRWGSPAIAQTDFARWAGDADPPAEPLERPADWPVPAARSASAEQLEWFALGYAVRALEGGKPATREELRGAVTRENVATARAAETTFKELPDRLKNADRSRGGRGRQT